MGIAFGTFFADLICFGLATVVEAPPCHLRIPGARVNVVLELSPWQKDWTDSFMYQNELYKCAFHW